MMKSILIFSKLIAILLLCGCNFDSRNKYQRYVDFPKNDKAFLSEEIESDSVYLRYPYRVEIKDSLAVILDLHPESHFLHAFTYPDWKHVISFGKRGESSDGILSAERVRICSPDSVWVLDSNRRQITRWRISMYKAERMEEIALDERLIRTLDFCKSETGFVVPDYSGNYRYHVLDPQGRITESVGSVPTEKNIAYNGRAALSQAWRSFMDYNPENGIMAMVTQLGEVIEVFNLKTGEHSVYYGPNGEPRFHASQGYGFPTGIMGFHDVRVAESSIFTVFQGTSFKDIVNGKSKGIPLPDGGKSIYIFTLSGIPLKRYELEMSVCGIWVNEKQNALVATDVYTNNLITKFELDE